MAAYFRVSLISSVLSVVLAAGTWVGNAQRPPDAGMLTDAVAEQLGDLQMFRHEYAAALDTYGRIPEHTAELWNKMGVAEHHMFALDVAIQDYELALSKDPHFADALNNLGAAYHGKRNYRQAERTYKRALKYEPHLAVAYGNLGTTYFAEHKYKKGVVAFQKAYALDAKVFDPARNQLVEEGSTREERVAANYSLAKVYAGAGKQDEAMLALRKALSAGFRDKKRLMEDKEFASLRQTQEFQQLLAEEHLE